jgi:hypothetical protein
MASVRIKAITSAASFPVKTPPHAGIRGDRPRPRWSGLKRIALFERPYRLLIAAELTISNAYRSAF